MKRQTPEQAAAWKARSKPLKRSGPIARKRAPAAPRSPQAVRKAEADAEYAVERDRRMVRARGHCEFVPIGSERCDNAATDCHHLVRRSHHLDHNVENLRVLCAYHHIVIIHGNVEWAKKNGWIETDWSQIEPRA